MSLPLPTPRLPGCALGSCESFPNALGPAPAPAPHTAHLHTHKPSHPHTAHTQIYAPARCMPTNVYTRRLHTCTPTHLHTTHPHTARTPAHPHTAHPQTPLPPCLLRACRGAAGLPFSLTTPRRPCGPQAQWHLPPSLKGSHPSFTGRCPLPHRSSWELLVCFFSDLPFLPQEGRGDAARAV